jgi:twitching motility two-component system response regulator PilG
MSVARATQLVEEGIAAAKAGAVMCARTAFREATRTDPANASAWLWAAAVAETPALAVRLLERAIQLDPTHAAANRAFKVARFEAGVAAANAGRRAEARGWLSQVCGDDPDNEAAWLWLAAVTDDPVEAICHLKQALRLNPANEKARSGIAQFRARIAAQWNCPICSAVNESKIPKCAHCHAFLDLAQGDAAIGNAGPDIGKIEAGIAQLKARLSNGPDYFTHYFLGMALLNLGRLEKAVEQFRSCRAMKPDDAVLAGQVDLLQRALAEADRPADPEAESTPPVPERENRLVLVIDGNTIIRKLVGMTLHKRGFRVAEAQDGQEAMEVIGVEGRPDLIVLDVAVPGTDGYALCRTIRKNPATARTPVVMMSARDRAADPARGRLAGVDANVTKPFDPAALVRVVGQFYRLDKINAPVEAD